jgi:UDP-N-acetylglucosamine 2-epimerase (non-hydrolysing)
LHRPSNVDDKQNFVRWLTCLGDIAKQVPIIFPMHPRTRKNINDFKIKVPSGIILLPALTYMEFLNLWKDCVFVLTDSGGLQEETTALGVPCFTLRDNTERPITVEQGTNIIIGNNYQKLKKCVRNVLHGKQPVAKIPKFWDGRASERIAKIILRIVYNNYAN